MPGLSRFLPPVWILEGIGADKAAKQDDARVPIELWNSRITLVLGGTSQALGILRKFFHGVLVRRVCHSFVNYMFLTHGQLWTNWVELAAVSTFSFVFDTLRVRLTWGYGRKWGRVKPHSRFFTQADLKLSLIHI